MEERYNDHSILTTTLAFTVLSDCLWIFKRFLVETSGIIEKVWHGKIPHSTSKAETAIFQINFLIKLKKVA